MIDILIAQILMVLGFIWIIYYSIKAVNWHWKKIEDIAEQMGRQKRKTYIFINEEEETEEEELAFAVPIDQLEKKEN